MSEMVDRVAARLRELPIRDRSNPGGELDELRLREAARAAIEAMREPTEAMKDVGSPTIVPPREAALVTTNDMSDFELWAPPFDDDAEVPDLMMVLSAVFVRLKTDAGFVDNLMEWMAATHDQHVERRAE